MATQQINQANAEQPASLISVVIQKNIKTRVMSKSKIIRQLNNFKYYSNYLIISLLLFIPSYVFAQTANSKTTSFKGGGAAIAGALTT
jgi:hypothetical protein